MGWTQGLACLEWPWAMRRFNFFYKQHQREREKSGEVHTCGDCQGLKGSPGVGRVIQRRNDSIHTFCKRTITKLWKYIRLFYKTWVERSNNGQMSTGGWESSFVYSISLHVSMVLFWHWGWRPGGFLKWWWSLVHGKRPKAWVVMSEKGGSCVISKDIQAAAGQAGRQARQPLFPQTLPYLGCL